MHFSLAQQRIAFLTAACLGSSQVLSAQAQSVYDFPLEPTPPEPSTLEQHRKSSSSGPDFLLLATRAQGEQAHQLSIVETYPPDSSDAIRREAKDTEGGQRQREQPEELEESQVEAPEPPQAGKLADKVQRRLVKINPLLLGFNFNALSGRNLKHLDRPGYSIRAGGQELNWRYRLEIVEYEGNLLLIGVPSDNPAEAKLLIARGAGGIEVEEAELTLEPGWRLTKRSYNGQPLEHLYLTHDQPLAYLGLA